MPIINPFIMIKAKNEHRIYIIGSCYFSMITVDLCRQSKSRWHSWIAQPPPKGQVGGSNPLRDANEIKVYSEDIGGAF